MLELLRHATASIPFRKQKKRQQAKEHQENLLYRKHSLSVRPCSLFRFVPGNEDLGSFLRQHREHCLLHPFFLGPQEREILSIRIALRKPLLCFRHRLHHLPWFKCQSLV